ncbi:SDR family oxidoreductase [Tumidithrix elongata RA019]|uniref:SDR family oxidoreductase n=1 Tax=Tumidithrix elongata BACA0141 TaxID=2716417 RepID=A0AAW9Q060_9CYAN|nr:SDR family oxidoreductase [Tumidithrix elongata RA019]
MKTVLITGASTGIGKATALEFQQRGWNVVATMRSPEKNTELANLSHVLCLRLDVTDLDSIQQAVETTIERFGAIDVLVNNAGYGLVGVFEASERSQIERQFATNVFGLMDVTRAVLPHFRERKQGAIVNVASIGGRLTFPLYSLYHSTKFAVEGFSEALQYELKPFQIRVKLIEPGAIKTDFYSRSADIMSRPGLTAYDRFIAKVLPKTEKAGMDGSSPESVAQVIYKASTDGSWKLRYPAGKNAGMLLFLRKLLPDAAFSAFIRRVLID